MIEKNETREYWVDSLIKIHKPLLKAANERILSKTMPSYGKKERMVFSNLEGVARTLMGISPWLENPAVDPVEEGRRIEMCELARGAIRAIIDPDSPDYASFGNEYGEQPLVDAAFLAQSILRAPNELYEKLTEAEKSNLKIALNKVRNCWVYSNNWLLFAACVETFFAKVGESFDKMRIDYAITSFQNWYKGDGIYGDGPQYHWDYYNSFVIIPMLNDILLHLPKGHNWESRIEVALKRSTRYAEILERMIAADGTYPVFGRSLCYRFGSMQAIAQASLLHILSENSTPAGVRCALTAVMRKTMSATSMFDENGWLTLGVYGQQPNMAEEYIDCGSLYLCSGIFLPLGLRQDDEFWANPDTQWINTQIWSGDNFSADHSIEV